MAHTYATSARSSAFQWFLHRITGTFLIFLLITHFWVQHYDARTATVTAAVVEQGELPEYSAQARAAVEARAGTVQQITPYDVVMTRLADPVYAVLWKGFNILFLIFALHHGFYGLNNVLGDYIRNDMLRVTVFALSWTFALVLLVVGLYAVITAGWGYPG
jgi:succinate dehydrogenase / fumarate reductase, membrane anchor subunit